MTLHHCGSPFFSAAELTMEYEYLSERVKALQLELVEIEEHNRQYFNANFR